MVTRSAIFAPALIAGLYLFVSACGALVTQNFFDGAASNNATPGNSSFTYELSESVHMAMNGQRFDRFGMTPSVLRSDDGAPGEVYHLI